MKNQFTLFWRKGLVVLCVIALAIGGLTLTGCPTEGGGGGGGGTSPSGGGVDDGVWSLLLGTWKSSDDELTYRFFIPPLTTPVKWLDLSTPDGGPMLTIKTISADIIAGTWHGDGKSWSFNFVLSNNNQTLTITNFIMHDNEAYSMSNGIVHKQP